MFTDYQRSALKAIIKEMLKGQVSDEEARGFYATELACAYERMFPDEVKIYHIDYDANDENVSLPHEVIVSAEESGWMPDKNKKIEDYLTQEVIGEIVHKKTGHKIHSAKFSTIYKP
jgi:hypothetical protein